MNNLVHIVPMLSEDERLTLLNGIRKYTPHKIHEGKLPFMSLDVSIDAMERELVDGAEYDMIDATAIGDRYRRYVRGTMTSPHPNASSINALIAKLKAHIIE